MLGPVVKLVAAGCVCVCTMVTSDVPIKKKPAVHRTTHAKHAVKHRRKAVHRKRRHHRVAHVKKVCSCEAVGGGGGITPSDLTTFNGDIFPPMTIQPFVDLTSIAVPLIAKPATDYFSGGGSPGFGFIGGGGYGGGYIGGGGGGGTITPPDTNLPPITTIPVTPVPEPATWAMMLIGFGMVGYFLRRNKVAFA